MKLMLLLISTLLSNILCAELAEIAYPFSRCCDTCSETLAVRNLVRWCRAYQGCSPVHECIRNCIYCHNPRIVIEEHPVCSVDDRSLLDFYMWLINNYQCMPKKLLKCLRACVTNFELYPSCYWTINVEVGISRS